MKSKFLLKPATVLLLSFITTLLFAQTRPPKQWDARFGGDANDFHPSLSGDVKQTVDGGYIIGGSTISGANDDISQPSQGGIDYWVVKTDANGIKQWDARFGGSGDDNGTFVQQTSDGGYILGGYSTSGISGDRTEASQGGQDFWVVKIDADGVKQWDKRYGGTGNDQLTALEQTSDGGYIFGGASDSPISGDKTQDNHLAGVDFWVVKTDANGVKQWDARYGSFIFGESIYSLQQTNDDGYILAGLTNSTGISGEQTQAARGMEDFWIVKIDASGTKQWDARFGGSEGEGFNSVRQTTDGGYIVAGSSNSGISGDKTQPNQGSGDFWLIKTDANGVKQWDAAFGGTDNDDSRSVRQTSDGGYIVGASTSSGMNGDKTQGSLGGWDFWVVKTDANGAKQWDARYGGNDHDIGYEVIQSADGGFVVAGISKSCIDHYKTQGPRGDYDLWLLKLYPEGTLGTFYRDNDNDGYGNAAVTVQAVDPPPGYVVNDLDCDDNNQFISPDCSSDGKSTFYADADNDGYGDPDVSVQACGQPPGYVADNTDCNDGNQDIYPGAPEVCNGVDDDCDGSTDEGLTFIIYYLDGDNDGYGASTDPGTSLCNNPGTGYSTSNTDCDDGNSNIHPGAAEVFNGLDDDCDGLTDEGLCNISVSAGSDENIYFGFTPDQCVSKTVTITGGTAPYTYSWTLNRALLSNVITNAGDETMTGTNAATVTVCLLDTAVLCITVTDANGCTDSACINIFAEDVRCFAGNTDNQKVKVCHSGKTICVDENAVAAHLAHGDYVGKCAVASSLISAEIPRGGSTKLSLYPNPSKGNVTVVYSSVNRGAIQIKVYDATGRAILQKSEQAITGDNHYRLNLSRLAAGIYYLELINGDRQQRVKFIIEK